MPVSKHFRDHYVEVQDDIVFARFVGNQTEVDMKELLSIVDEQIAAKPWYVIVDARKMGQIEPDARKYFSKWAADIPNQAGCIVYGATTMTRAFGTLVQGAMRLFSSKHVPLVFVDSQEEARAWIEEHKRKRSNGSATSTGTRGT